MEEKKMAKKVLLQKEIITLLKIET